MKSQRRRVPSSISRRGLSRLPLFTSSMLLPMTEMMYWPGSSQEPSMTGTLVLVMHRMMSTSCAARGASATGSTGTRVISVIFRAKASRCACVGLYTLALSIFRNSVRPTKVE